MVEKICWGCKHFGHFHSSCGICGLKTGSFDKCIVDALDTCERFELAESEGKQDESDS